MLGLKRRLSLATALNAIVLATAPVCAADQALIDAAKKEGKAVWYTTQQINPLVVPVVEAFTKKYGVAVDYVRADSSDVALRILNEGKVGRMQSDVFDGTGAAAILKKEKMVVHWLPDGAKRLPKEYVDPDGYWTATNIFVVTPGYNTNLVTPGSEPKTLADLLDPKWKGKMIWSTQNSGAAGPGFVGLILSEMGPEKGMDYLRRLAGQDVTGSAVSGRQILDQVIAGEYAIGLQIFNHASVLSAQQGAPVKWIPMNPALLTFNVIGLTAGGPHPNAGKLLIDFAISSEGQELYKKGAVLTVDPDIAPFDPALRPDGAKFRAIAQTPEDLERNLPGWLKTFKDLFR
jgi:ABC-type Fe3+ transport system substrate-binding protein